MNWAKGDRCFFEFKEAEVREAHKGCVKEVSDGYFVTSGDLTDRCFPINHQARIISDFFRDEFERLHQHLPGQYNFPDFLRYASSEWSRAMVNQHQMVVAEDICLRFHSWCSDLIEIHEGLKNRKVGGVHLLRR